MPHRPDRSQGKRDPQLAISSVRVAHVPICSCGTPVGRAGLAIIKWDWRAGSKPRRSDH
jgi:hypothetical protein